MELMQIGAGGREAIGAYGEHGFEIAGRVWPRSVLVLPGGVVEWPVADVATLSVDHFEAVFEVTPPIEIVLLGCGHSSALIGRELREAVRRRGVVLEAMGTGAACRTYNLLIAEDRRVAAALIALTPA